MNQPEAVHSWKHVTTIAQYEKVWGPSMAAAQAQGANVSFREPESIYKTRTKPRS